MESLEHKKEIDCVYIDFAKAFDSVPSRLLVGNLKGYGISGKLLKWISSFIVDRKYRVRVGNSYSSEHSVLSGVAQGSVLGPLLFLLYINDLPRCLPSGVTAKLYADDVKIYVTHSNYSDTRPLLQTALNCLNDWSVKWKLPISASKCSVLHISRKAHRSTPFDYSLGSVNLPISNTVRDLGVLVDSKLTFDSHINTVIKNGFFKCHLLLRTLKTLNIKLYAQAFKTYVRPIIEYAPEVWHPNKKKDIMRIEKIQRFYTRIAFKRCKLRKCSYEERLRIMNLEPLDSRRIKSDLCSVFRLLF